MKCHYAVLEVARDADDVTIKKSYRKLALKWHPDKNPDNLAECTQYFALVQQAYEVLSDPQERAFYDRHRESFIKGGFDGNYKEDSLVLFKYFTVSCFTGFGDDDKGFYTVYRKVFDTLTAEDYDFIEEEEDRNYPSFGNADSDYEKVVGVFYGFWSSFMTARSFAWLDQHDIRQAQNRYVMKQMEAENKKYRDAGRSERSEQIRELVAFIRKRDPRVKKYRELLEERQLLAKQKQEENRKQQLRNNQEQMQDRIKAAEADRDAYLLEVSKALHEEDTCSESEDDEGEQLPHCVVCNKSFKTANAKINHEQSKQHKKALQELKKHLKEEDAALFDTIETESPKEEKKGKKNKRKSRKNGLDDDVVVPEVQDIAEVSTVNENDEVEKIEETFEKIDIAEVEAPTEKVDEDEKKDKKKRRRANKKDQKDDDKDENDVVDTTPKTGKCDRCKEVFESRSKLFEHLKLTGHATLLVNKKPEPIPKNKKGKRGNRRGDDDEW